VPQHTEYRCDYDHNPRTIFIYKYPSQQRNDYVGEGIKRIKKVEFELVDRLALVFKILFDELLKCLAHRMCTLALSKQY